MVRGPLSDSNFIVISFKVLDLIYYLFIIDRGFVVLRIFFLFFFNLDLLSVVLGIVVVIYNSFNLF